MTTIQPVPDPVTSQPSSSGSQGLSPLELRNVSFVDDFGATLLENVWLKAKQDTTTCIIGSNGRDQAALLSLLTGLAEPTRGSVCFEGISLADLSTSELRSGVALVLRNPWITQASVADNIGFGLAGVARSDIEAAARLAEVDTFVDFLPDGYDTIVTVRRALDVADDGSVPDPGASGSQPNPIALTLGQQRRLALARTLLRDPAVLVLEEPTTDLEPDEERLFLRLLDKIAAGRVTLIASHRLAVARRADKVLVIDDGRLVPYSGATVADGTSDHSQLWDLRVPPVHVPAGGSHLRVVGTDERRPKRPISAPWGIEIGEEMAPGFVASGLLGRTEHCDVWASWSEQRQRPVRIKVPRSVPVNYQSYAELSREFKSVRSLRHPGLAAAYEADLEAEMPFVVYEYLNSEPLSTAIKSAAAEAVDTTGRKLNHGLAPLDVLYIGFELAGALNYMHHRGFVHLHLRARHVRTRGDTIVISDFAQARRAGERVPAPIGTGNGHRGEHAWFPPEQLPGRSADPKMDIYALGALLHLASAGSVRSAPTAAIRNPRSRLVPYAELVSVAPASMAETIDLMLAEDPSDRPDAEEVLRRFRRILPSSLFRPRLSEIDYEAPALHAMGANN